MNIFIESHQKLLGDLIQHNVTFLLIGGYAVIYHGYKRSTGDMDIWLKPSNENKLKLIEVLKKYDFDKEGLSYISNMDFTKHIAFHFWNEPERVDCLTHISNVVFSEAYTQKVIADFDGIPIPFIHYNDLVMSKIMSDRLKDKADVEELQKVNRFKKPE